MSLLLALKERAWRHAQRGLLERMKHLGLDGSPPSGALAKAPHRQAATASGTHRRTLLMPGQALHARKALERGAGEEPCAGLRLRGSSPSELRTMEFAQWTFA